MEDWKPRQVSTSSVMLPQEGRGLRQRNHYFSDDQQPRKWKTFALLNASDLPNAEVEAFISAYLGSTTDIRVKWSSDTWTIQVPKATKQSTIRELRKAFLKFTINRSSNATSVTRIAALNIPNRNQTDTTVWRNIVDFVERIPESTVDESDVEDIPSTSADAVLQAGILMHPPLLHNLTVDDSAVGTHFGTTFDAINLPNQNTCQMCHILYILWFTIVAGSLAVGLWRSFATGDEGKGFTDAAYVVAVGGVIIYPVQSRHNERCRRARRNG